MHKIVVGVITYGDSTAKYLPYFLHSLKRQTGNDFKLIVVDNTPAENNENQAIINNLCDQVEIDWPGENIGFAAAYNRMINKAIAEGAEYFIALNPDMILKSDFLENLLKAINHNWKIGTVAPLIYKWDFAKKENGRTEIIDSCGIGVSGSHCFFDINQGKEIKKELKPGFVFGGTGAAVLYRLQALKDVAIKAGDRREFFDESMFMYKEDCDLAYRMQLAGWKTLFTPRAICHHDRTAAGGAKSFCHVIKERKAYSAQVNKWSYRNHRIILLKYSNLPHTLRVRINTYIYEIKKLAYIILFERYLLKEFEQIRKIKHEILKKARQTEIRITKKELRDLFKNNYVI